MKLKQKVERKTAGWKITSIRFAIELAQKIETLQIKNKVRSPTEAITQLLEAATKSVKALPAKKLDWAKKADASARKQYGKAAARKAKPAKKAAPRKAAAKKAAPKKTAKPAKQHKPKAVKAPKAEAKPELPNGAPPQAGQSSEATA